MISIACLAKYPHYEKNLQRILWLYLDINKTQMLPPYCPQAITIIFKSLNIKCVPYIQTVIPAYLTVFRTADSSFREVRLVHPKSYTHMTHKLIHIHTNKHTHTHTHIFACIQTNTHTHTHPDCHPCKLTMLVYCQDNIL